MILLNLSLDIIHHAPKGNKSFDPQNPNPAISHAPYRIYNIGNSTPIKLLDMIEILEKKLGKKAIRKYLPIQAGDVSSTHADIEDLVDLTKYRPKTRLKDGLSSFVDWFQTYHKT